MRVLNLAHFLLLAQFTLSLLSAVSNFGLKGSQPIVDPVVDVHMICSKRLGEGMSEAGLHCC